MVAAVLVLSGCGLGQSDEEVLSSKTFGECVKQGGIIMEMYPRQCRDQEGNVFVEQVGSDEAVGEGTKVCEDNCGNGVCEEVVCEAVGCPCAETVISCPQDCR